MLRPSRMTAQTNEQTSFLSIANVMWTSTLMGIFQDHLNKIERLNIQPLKMLLRHQFPKTNLPAIIPEQENSFVSEALFVLSMTILV